MGIEVQEWADRVWEAGIATRIGPDYRALASAMLEKLTEDPDGAAHVIAALVQQTNETCE